MHPSPRRRAPRSVSLWLALVAACAAGLMGGSRSASASCGDWLEGHAAAHDRVGTASDATHPAAVLLRLPPAAVAFHDAVPLDRPCDGPACRRAPILPQAPVDAAGPIVEAERAIPAGLSGDDVPRPSAPARPGDDPHLSSAVPGRLERPPRRG